jgi:hypothetical protein
MSRLSAGALSGVGFLVGGAIGAGIAAEFGTSKEMFGPATKHEVERMTAGGAVGALLGAVIFAAVGADPSCSPPNQCLPPPRFP